MMNVAAKCFSARPESPLADQDLDRLLVQHAPLVKSIGYRLMARLPESVQIEDLLQAGAIGLLEAARHYNPSHGASFETYAGIRIRGAMLDELRRTDWTPRSVHCGVRSMANAVRAIENREGREARHTEVAAVMGLDMRAYARLLWDASVCRVLSVEEVQAAAVITAQQNEPAEAHQRETFVNALAEAIDALPERERLIMSLHYGDDLNLREIGVALGVTESRVCQIHGKAVMRLRAHLSDWLDVRR